MTPLSVVLVGSSPWSAELTDDDLNLVTARALAERLGGRYHVIVPCGSAPPEELDLGAVWLHRIAARTRLGFVLAARRHVDLLAARAPRRPLLLSSDPLASLAVEWSRARRTCPHLVQVQSDVVTPGPEYGGRLKRHALGAATRYAVRRASGVRAVSGGIGAAVSPLASGPVEVIGVRADTSRFRPADRPASADDTGALHVVMVGNLLDVKNQATVVRAWSRVVEALPDARLTIVGEGPCRRGLEALISELGLADAVTLAGRLPHGEVAALLARARCLAHASWSEGGPRAVLEAMACGLPVVCSDIPRHREVVLPQVGRLVPTTDVDGWAATIIGVLRDPAGSAEMGRQARALVVERYDFAPNMDTFAAFIRRIGLGAPSERIGAHRP